MKVCLNDILTMIPANQNIMIVKLDKDYKEKKRQFHHGKKELQDSSNFLLLTSLEVITIAVFDRFWLKIELLEE